MISRSEQLQQWFKQRTGRERILILLAGLAVIYAFWYFLLSRPLHTSQRELDKKIVGMQAQISTFKQQTDFILNTANKNSYYQKLQEQKKAAGQAQGLQQKLETVKSVVIPYESLSKVTKDVLNQQEGIHLISLKKLDMTPWAPPGIENIEALSKYAKIYKQSFEINFHSGYFSTIRYLSRLEKLPWRLYWDSLEYNVDNYPEAQVVIRFYVLVNQ
jgi:MSHA biogenesis protein MshJ